MGVVLGFLSDDVEDSGRSFEWNFEKVVARGEYIKIFWLPQCFNKLIYGELNNVV